MAHPMEARIVAALRRYGATHAAVMRGFADHLALHPTDAAALTEVLTAEDAGAPLGPADLARRLGLSRPAVSASLNRLAGAGLVCRRPDPADGRRTALVAAPHVAAATGRFFAPHSAALARALDGEPDDRLEDFARLLDRLSGAMSDALGDGSTLE